MPDPATLLLFAAAAVALVAVPGPNVVYLTTRSLSQGRAGIASALGIETGTLVHVGGRAAAGLSALLASSALAYAAVRYAGAAYLVFLGVRTLLRRDPAGERPTGAPPVSLARAYADGLVVQLLNPKVALFFLAFLPQFVDTARASAPQILTLGAVLGALGFAIDALHALAAGAAAGWLRARPAVVRGAQRHVTGAVYLALGATAALTGSRR